MRNGRTVILGAGFGGLNVAMELARLQGRARAGEVLLVDRNNYHLFTPILYQVATGLVEPGHILYPIRVLARQYGFDFQESNVRHLDLERREIITDDGSIPYGQLVVATGSATNFFGMDQIGRHALTLKTIGDSIQIRNRLIDAFERADVEPDPEERRRRLTTVIVGGGATGVELMGSLSTLVRESILPTYPSLRPDEVRLVLVEAMPEILAGLDPGQAKLARGSLQEMGVELRTGTMVTDADEQGITTKDGERIPAGVVVWAAGVRASPMLEDLPAEKGKAGRLVVNAEMRLPEWPNVYALGDVAAFTDRVTGQLLPPNAAVAVRQGKHLGRNLSAALEGSRTRPFRYVPIGELVALGRGRAVADIKGIKFAGFPAWLVWRTYYLSQIMGFKSRLGVLLDWTYAYFKRRDITRLEIATESTAEQEKEVLGAPRARRKAAS